MCVSIHPSTHFLYPRDLVFRVTSSIYTVHTYIYIFASV